MTGRAEKGCWEGKCWETDEGALVSQVRRQEDGGWVQKALGRNGALGGRVLGLSVQGESKRGGC